MRIVIVKKLFGSYIGFTFYPFIFVVKGKHSLKLMRHEYIHAMQQKEMLVIPFYIVYLLNYIFNLVYYRLDIKRAYRNICFEREAYENEYDANYLKYRKKWSWTKYF